MGGPGYHSAEGRAPRRGVASEASEKIFRDVSQAKHKNEIACVVLSIDIINKKNKRLKKIKKDKKNKKNKKIKK